MNLETNSANEIRANWLELKFKLIIIDLTLFVNQAQNSDVAEELSNNKKKHKKTD